MRPWAPAIRSPGPLSAGQANLRCAPGDETILEDAAVTYLMSLEHQLTEVLGLMRAPQHRADPPAWIDARPMLGRGRTEHLAPAER